MQEARGDPGVKQSQDDIHNIALLMKQMVGYQAQVLFGHASQFTLAGAAYREISYNVPVRR